MSRVIFHNHAAPGAIEMRRAAEWEQLQPEQRWQRLLNLIRLSVLLNGGRPLKQPQGKGLIIRKNLS